MADLIYSAELLADIKKLPRKVQGKILAAVREDEWKKCEASVEYWLDPTLHTAECYAYTWDPKSLYTCMICAEINPTLASISHPEDKMVFHMQHKHGIEVKTLKEAMGNFTRLPTFRPWTMKEYMPPIIKEWKEAKLFAIEKSRDMMATWLMVMLHFHDMAFHEGRQHVFQSKDAPSTRYLVEDCAYFTWSRMPKWMRQRIPATFIVGGNKSGYMQITNTRSEIIGLPQGADQIRRLHPSAIFFDECAFLKLAADTFAAAKPAIQQGGKFSAISSAFPGWFQLFCQDKTDE